MNIIGGIAKRTIIKAPKGFSVRPTGARARKSIFDSYRNWEGKIVVDLFAGTGVVGLEAASRGASEVYFIEKLRKNCNLIYNNIEKVKKAGVETKMEVICSDATSAYKYLVDLHGKVDVIFADPPYSIADEMLQKILEDKDFKAWASGALLIFEVPSEISRKPVFNEISLWKLETQRKLGQSIFLFFNN
jgi:16S rRNA (guanine966-N2)-methyltransferase